MEALYARCSKYVKAFDPADQRQKKILRSFLERAEQRAKDNNSSTVQEIDNILVDYLWDNKGKLEKQDKAVIFNLCVYFCFYVDQKLNLPFVVATSLTNSKIEQLTQWIDVQIAEAK